MRIELSSSCNYRCNFCCWQNASVSPPFLRFARGQLTAFCRGLVNSGCRNINLTGGEPLLLPRDYLCETIEAIRGTEGVNKLWVTTNGSMLRDSGFCQSLARAGLKEIAVSVASGTDEGYMAYTNSDVMLSEIMRGIENAAECGISVRIHVPLSPLGIHSFEQLEILLDKAAASGVTEAFYFRLHNSGIIEEKYDELFIDPIAITEGFKRSERWNLSESGSGRLFFTNGKVSVNVPGESVRLVTQNCKSRNCGSYCQGIYSAYCIPGKDGWTLRACHRIFADKNNEYPLDKELLKPERESGLRDLLRSVWRYAYEE